MSFLKAHPQEEPLLRLFSLQSPLMAASLHAPTFLSFPSIFSSLQSPFLLVLCQKEKASINIKINQGNSAPLSLVPFGGILPLRYRQNPKFRTFIWYSKVPGGSEAQLLDSVGTIPSKDKDNSRYVNREEIVSYLAQENEHEMPTQNDSDFERKDLNFNATNLDGYTKFAMRKINSNSEIRPRFGNLQIGDCVDKILGLPIEERVKVLDLLHCDNKSFTISDYNDISYALMKAEAYESVVSIFSELKSNGFTPDHSSFSILIYCMCKKNDPFEAKRVMDEMIANGFNPTVATFTSVVQGLCKRGRVTIALEVLDKMHELNVDPIIRTYNYLIGGLCYVGRLEEAYELVQDLKNTPTKPDIYTFTLVIDAYCRVGMLEKAVELFNESKETGLEPTLFTYTALLNGFCKENRPVLAVSFLREMECSNICAPDLVSYNIILDGLLAKRKISLALKIFERMRERGFQTGERTMNSLLRGVCRLSFTNVKYLKDAKNIFEMIKGLGFRPTTFTYCLMIQALAKAGSLDKAVACLKEAVNAGASPRILTYNIVIRILCRKGRVYDALEVMVVMVKSGKMLSMFSLCVLLNEFCKQGKNLDAFGVYCAALKRGLDPFWRKKFELKCESKLNFGVEKKEEEVLV